MNIDIKKDGFWYKIAGYNLSKNPLNEVGLVSFLMKIIFMISLGWLFLLPTFYFYYIWPSWNFDKDKESGVGIFLMIFLSYAATSLLLVIAAIISMLIIEKLGLSKHDFVAIFLIIFSILSFVLFVIRKILLYSPKNKSRILVRFVKR